MKAQKERLYFILYRMTLEEKLEKKSKEESLRKKVKMSKDTKFKEIFRL